MIEKLILENFQKHKKLELDLDPGITTILGESDSGKSSVARAFGWIASNSIGGSEFIRHGTKSAKVSLVVDNVEISRKRGKSANSYSMDGDEFKAFGRGVPEPIEDLLRIGSINTQNQHDAPFWFSLSAGEVARQINKIVNLSVIDKSLATVASRIRESQTELKLLDAELIEIDAKIEDSKYVEEMDADLRKLEEMDSELSKIGDGVDGLDSRIGIFRECSSILKRKKVYACEASLLVALFEELQDLIEDESNLSKLVSDFRIHHKNSSVEIPDISELETLSETVEDVSTKYDTLEHCVNQFKAFSLDQTQSQLDAKNMEKELNELMGDVCPLCGTQLDHEH